MSWGTYGQFPCVISHYVLQGVLAWKGGTIVSGISRGQSERFWRRVRIYLELCCNRLTFTHFYYDNEKTTWKYEDNYLRFGDLLGRQRHIRTMKPLHNVRRLIKQSNQFVFDEEYPNTWEIARQPQRWQLLVREVLTDQQWSGLAKVEWRSCHGLSRYSLYCGNNFGCWSMSFTTASYQVIWINLIN